MSKEKKILYDDPNCVKFMKKEVEGWFSSDETLYYGRDEAHARYMCCTHKKCEECGKEHEIRSYCESCRKRVEREKWEKMEKRPWDGNSCISLWDGDKWFSDEDELDQYCEENECKKEDLMLVHSKTVFVDVKIDPDDLLAEYENDDGEIKGTEYLSDIFEEINEKLKKDIEKYNEKFGPACYQRINVAVKF